MPTEADAFNALMRQCGFTWWGPCAGCRLIIFRRRGPRGGQLFYCQEKRCQALKKLGHDKPVSLDSVPSDFTHSPIREMSSYHGGYPE